MFLSLFFLLSSLVVDPSVYFSIWWVFAGIRNNCASCTINVGDSQPDPTTNLEA